MLKILIAEDDMVSRKILRKVLEEFGECDLVINGLEAVDAVMLSLREKEGYDLICLDIMMPKLDGVKALRTIRELEDNEQAKERSKIIMITALSEIDVIDEAFEKGADAYANKPLDIGKLKEVMRNLKLII